MAEEERDRISALALLVNEMDLEVLESVHSNGGHELGECVQLFFVLPPIVSILPVGSQALDILQRTAIIPIV